MSTGIFENVPDKVALRQFAAPVLIAVFLQFVVRGIMVDPFLLVRPLNEYVSTPCEIALLANETAADGCAPKPMSESIIFGLP